MEDSIKNFVLGFLNNLKAEFELEKEVLRVKKISREFEGFSGKKAPYSIVFKLEDETENCELMIKGSLLLKAMTSYLESKGQTTLLKLVFPEPIESVKSHLMFKNCDIFRIDKKEENKYFLRFTFLTTFQYLNEKEQIMNSIYVFNNNITEFDISKFYAEEGKKGDLEIKDTDRGYNLAREKLKELVKEKIQQVSNDLDRVLEKEVLRVKEHYKQQTDDIKKELEKNQELLKGEDVSEIRLKKAKENIVRLKAEGESERLKKEEEFFIQDEIQKHSLNIDNKLINTSIIYYPRYEFDIFLKNKDTGRQLRLEYDPLNKIFSKVECETCKKEIRELTLCSSGHVICSGCIGTCGGCRKQYCNGCLEKNCEICGLRVCRKCLSRCLKCGKRVCKSHLQKTGSGELCTGCLKKCSGCGMIGDSKNIGVCLDCGQGIGCEKCLREKKLYCTNCYTLCSCGGVQKKSLYGLCTGCNFKECLHLKRCMACRKRVCVRLKR